MACLPAFESMLHASCMRCGGWCALLAAPAAVCSVCTVCHVHGKHCVLWPMCTAGAGAVRLYIQRPLCKPGRARGGGCKLIKRLLDGS
jgi:hypothetical protein